MSDDSHGIKQVATNYGRAVKFMNGLGVKDVWTFQRSPHPGVEQEAKAGLEEVSVPLQVFKTKFDC